MIPHSQVIPRKSIQRAASEQRQMLAKTLLDLGDHCGFFTFLKLTLAAASLCPLLSSVCKLKLLQGAENLTPVLRTFLTFYTLGR